MAYDKTLPTNSTKIRNYPTVLTDNFAAIEEGDISLKHWQVNFIERNAVPGAPPPANDPTRADDTMILFSKQDAAGETELFFMDDQNPANVTQVTQGGALGGASTNILGTDISFDGGTFTNNQNGMCTAWSFVTVVGSAISTQTNYGMTWTRTSTGVYKATFTASQVLNANYVVTGTAYSSSGGSEGTVLSFASDKTRSTTEFSIRMKHVTSDSNRDRSFMVAVFGGR